MMKKNEDCSCGIASHLILRL